MANNTKLLVIFSFLIIIIGVSVLFIGLNHPATSSLPSTPSPTAVSQVQPTIATSSAIAGVEGERVQVTRVVDGDTIVVSIGANMEKTVRFIGMDTPETVDPKRPVGCFGKEASNETKSLLTGKTVILQKDVSETDKYGRILRYIFLPLPDGQTLFVNDLLVREGFARVLTYPPDVKYDGQFKQAQDIAKQLKKGLWGSC